MTKRLLFIAALALATAAGVLAALVVAPTARAWSPEQMSDLGYQVRHTHDVAPPAGVCSDTWSFQGYGGSLFVEACDPDFQGKLDAFVNATCPCAQAPPPTTDAATTAASTTAPTDTSTVPTSTDPTSTGPTSTTAPPSGSAPVTTTTVATDPAADAKLAELEARIVALEQQIAALTTRVDRLEVASDAAQLAFEQSLASGSDVATAAAAARGTYLNAEYGLGAFA